MPRTLIFNFDGTWNGRDDEHGTNIRRIHRGLSQDGQVPMYFAGPGNEDESGYFEHFLGGALGVGAGEIRDRGYDALEAAYKPGDSIAAFGFSRGATVARMFAAKIAKDGVNGETLDIDFLGCFDTVAAFLPFGIQPLSFGGKALFHDLHVSPKVKRACHALALDEDRKSFTPNLMNAREGIEEVWFPGVHADIGGGFAETGLSDCALDWMVAQAWGCGLKFTQEFADAILPEPTADIHVMDSHMRRERRKVGVMENDDWSDRKPFYHVSAMDRVRNVEGYRPELAA